MGWFWRGVRDLTLLDVVDHLIEHPDQMYISPSREMAMVYYPPDDSIVVIYGDFSGSEEECVSELQRGLQQLVARNTAWLN